MPPRLALPALNVAEHEWAGHGDLAALTNHALDLLPTDPGQAELLERDYATLRSCLADQR